MKNFAKDVRTLTIKNLEEIRKIDKIIKNVKELEQEKIYTWEYAASEIAKLKALQSQIIKDGKTKVMQMAGEYRAKLRDEFMPRAEDITTDAALFTSGIALTSDQLDVLAARYTDNRTMTQLIYDHAESRGITLSRHRVTEAEKASLADNLVSYYSSAMQRPYFPEWESDSYFEALTDGMED